MEIQDSPSQLWMKRILRDEHETLRLKEVVARYAYLLSSSEPILTYLDLEDLAYIGSVLQMLPPSDYTTLAPYSFGDLHLGSLPTLQKTFNALPFPVQCKALDTARAYRQAHPPYAMVALDWQQGTFQLLALSAQKEKLPSLSLAFLTDPLTETMIDSRHEPEKAFLLSQAEILLNQATEEKRIGVYSVTCSDELFVNALYASILDFPFTLEWGNEQDCLGRTLPKHITHVADLTGW